MLPWYWFEIDKQRKGQFQTEEKNLEKYLQLKIKTFCLLIVALVEKEEFGLKEKLLGRPLLSRRSRWLTNWQISLEIIIILEMKAKVKIFMNYLGKLIFERMHTLKGVFSEVLFKNVLPKGWRLKWNPPFSLPGNQNFSLRDHIWECLSSPSLSLSSSFQLWAQNSCPTVPNLAHLGQNLTLLKFWFITFHNLFWPYNYYSYILTGLSLDLHGCGCPTKIYSLTSLIAERWIKNFNFKMRDISIKGGHHLIVLICCSNTPVCFLIVWTFKWLVEMNNSKSHIC